MSIINCKEHAKQGLVIVIEEMSEEIAQHEQHFAANMSLGMRSRRFLGLKFDIKEEMQYHAGDDYRDAVETLRCCTKVLQALDVCGHGGLKRFTEDIEEVVISHLVGVAQPDCVTCKSQAGCPKYTQECQAASPLVKHPSSAFKNDRATV